MNPMTLLAALFGCAAVILAYMWLAAKDDADAWKEAAQGWEEQWPKIEQQRAALQSQNTYLTQSRNQWRQELIEQAQYLEEIEKRNDYLELLTAKRCVMYTLGVATETRLVVIERNEAP